MSFHQHPNDTTDIERAARTLEHVRENVRLMCSPEQLVFLIDEFTAATPHWPAFNRARAIHRAMEQGFREFHADRAAERAAGMLFDPSPPWQYHRRKWEW